ncbi:hypothetical protein [Streptomyces sp. NPDC002346]
MSSPSLHLIRRATTVSTVVLAMLFATFSAPVIADAPAEVTTSAAVTSVAVNSANSADLTYTTEGTAELNEFVDRNTESIPELATMDLSALQSKYKVMKVDLRKISAAYGVAFNLADCGASSETLVAPRGATNIRYSYFGDDTLDPNYNPNVMPSAPCDLNISWDDAPDMAQDDPDGSATTASPSIEEYSSHCFARKITYNVVEYFHDGATWNDGCYYYTVERNDGNGTYNWYTAKVKSTCGSSTSWEQLDSCGHGIETTGPYRGYWYDWAPANDSEGGCRTINYTVSILVYSVSGSYSHCEKQIIYKYSAIKMSSYWKGEVDTATRSTRHQVAIKMGQYDGRPQWHNWMNSSGDTCYSGTC